MPTVWLKSDEKQKEAFSRDTVWESSWPSGSVTTSMRLIRNSCS